MILFKRASLHKHSNKIYSKNIVSKKFEIFVSKKAGTIIPGEEKQGVFCIFIFFSEINNKVIFLHPLTINSQMQTIEKSGELIFLIISLVLLGAGWVFSGVVPPECRFLKYFEIYFLWDISCKMVAWGKRVQYSD